MLLTIDVGNTRTKWGVFDSQGELKAHGILLNTDMDMTDMPIAWRVSERAVISNVAGATVAAALEKSLLTLKVPVHWIASGEQACGLKNGYKNPEQLGTDRWAALVAAWQHYREPCIVVNAGTALTIDAIGINEESGQGVFLGGLIVPGLQLMQQSLARGTAGIGEHAGAIQDFPDNTGAAVYAGALSAMAGAVESMFAKLRLRMADAAGEGPRCILSGGDANALADILLNSVGMAKKLVIADNLVLQGLLLIEREEAL